MSEQKVEIRVETGVECGDVVAKMGVAVAGAIAAMGPFGASVEYGIEAERKRQTMERVAFPGLGQLINSGYNGEILQVAEGTYASYGLCLPMRGYEMTGVDHEVWNRLGRFLTPDAQRMLMVHRYQEMSNFGAFDDRVVEFQEAVRSGLLWELPGREEYFEVGERRIFVGAQSIH